MVWLLKPVLRRVLRWHSQHSTFRRVSAAKQLSLAVKHLLIRIRTLLKRRNHTRLVWQMRLLKPS